LQNVEIATSSTDRDVYREIPNFTKMYEKRLLQATLTNNMIENYKEENKLTDEDLINRDVDEVSESIMRLINYQVDQLSQQEETDSKENLNKEEHLSNQDKSILSKQQKALDNFDLSSPIAEVSKEEQQYQKILIRQNKNKKKLLEKKMKQFLLIIHCQSTI